MSSVHQKLNQIEVPTERGISERRFVYGGDRLRASAGDFVARGNRPVRRRKRSILLIIASLMLTSLLIVASVWNKIAVNHLVIEVNELHSRYNKIMNTNELLRAEINQKASLERIGKIATGQLHLISPREQPDWIYVDAERAANFGH